MRTGCVCAIGAAAANPVLSGIKLFREEYEEHIRGKICKSGSRRSSHQV
jgi:NADH:ubiquinone oxidoreductase subunit F (NADH-binding)